MAADTNRLIALVLLDLSAAFDTVDHGILVHRVAECGVSGTALMWVSSFLNIYMQPLITTLIQMGCETFSYADDTQLILSMGNSVEAQESVQNTLRFVVHWMTVNWLKINPDKFRCWLLHQRAAHGQRYSGRWR